MKRILLAGLICVIAFPVLLVAAFYGYENWQGERAWRAAKSALEDLGEPLNVRDFQPASIPDSDNMASAPIFSALFSDPGGAPVNALRIPLATVASRKGDPDVVRLARRFQSDFDGDAATAAVVVHAGLQPMEPMLDAIARAASRPSAVWPIDYDMGFDVAMPFLPPLRGTCEVLRARALASIAARQPESALADVALITRLALRANQPPVLIGCLAQQDMLGGAIDVIRAGLDQGAWSDAQLQELDDLLAQCRPLESLRTSIRGERALFIASSGELGFRAAPFFTFVDFRSPWSERITRTLSSLVWSLRPSGWEALDRASYVTFAQEWLNFVTAENFVRPWALARWADDLRSLRKSSLDFFRKPLTVLSLPTFPVAARRAAYAQAQVDLARIACALERYRMKNQTLPDSLDALVAGWLPQVPRDVILGGRYFYEAQSAGAFRLYGKGWNGRDDGGRNDTINTLIGPSSADDWVWRSAAWQMAAAEPTGR